MKLRIACVGRMKSGPEADLTRDYLDRFDKTGRAIGLGPVDLVEVTAKKSSMSAEAVLLEKAVAGAAVLCVLDERGRQVTSPDFAAMLSDWRDRGLGDAAFVIGGADGIAPALRARADAALSLGRMVWPHMLVRVMLAEQLYRAASILTGSPYHRE